MCGVLVCVIEHQVTGMYIHFTEMVHACSHTEGIKGGKEEGGSE